MSLDFSTRPELDGLALVVRAVQAAAEPAGIDFCLTGAAARDLMTRYAHGIEPSRLTEDLDFAVMVRDWEAYGRLRETLIASGEFSPRPGPATHRLRHVSGLPLDIVPFGGIEGRDRKFAWPPDHSTVFDCFGMNEAFAASLIVELPGAVRLLVPPIPALTILKIAAWEDRRHTHPGRDALDLLLYLRHYMDCGNLERAAVEHADLFEAEEFDHVEAGVRLLARDISLLLDRPGVERLLQTLVREADEAGNLLLAHQSGLDLATAQRLLEVLCDELAGRLGST
jgi:predicted nucleotidyltransferase